MLKEKAKPVRTTLYLPPDLWKRAKIEAIKQDVDATDVVVWALEAWLKNKKGESQ